MPSVARSNRAEVVRYAILHTAADAAARYAKPIGTVKSWVKRAKDRGELPEDLVDGAVGHPKAKDASAVASGASAASKPKFTGTPWKRKSQEEERNSSGDQPTKAPATDAPKRPPTRSETFLDKLREQCERAARAMATMKITEGNIHRFASGMEKLERAGRVPFGYATQTASAGLAGHGQALVNINLHNGTPQKGSGLPAVVEAEVIEEDGLPPVSIENEQPLSDAQEDDSQVPQPEE